MFTGIIALLSAIGPFASVLGPLAMNILNAIIGAKNTTEADKATLNEVAAILRKNGIKNAKSRYEAEGQIKPAADEWAQREQPKPPQDPPV